MFGKTIATLAVAVLLLGTATACTPEPIVSVPSASAASQAVPLKVGIPQIPDGVSPQEGALVAHVYAAALNAAGVQAIVSDGSGTSAAPAGSDTPSATGSPTAPDATVSSLESGSVDVVPLFSRIALSEVASAGTVAETNDVLAALKTALPSRLVLLDAAKAEEYDALVVTAVTAEKYQLKSISDLAKVCDKLVVGGTAEFKTKARGLAGLGSAYNCVPKQYESLQPTLGFGNNSILWSLLRDEIQVADIHTSSPAIEDNSLVVLSDPKQLFLSQNVVPVVVQGKVPADVQSVINKVSAALSTEELSNLNRLSGDRHYGGFSEVATAWLIQKGLVKASS